MQKLNVNLKHCYGIKKLEHEFDFSVFHTAVIYAPNGVMKTSFAKTCKDISNTKKPYDQMDESLISKYDFLIDNTSSQINSKLVCVIEPYNEKAFDSEEKILTLLADETTRNEYLAIYNEIESLKKSTISSLKTISGSSNYEAEINESFSDLNKRNIFEIFDEILEDVKNYDNSFEFKYNDVFDKAGKVKKFLDENFILLQKYIDKYNELISDSSFFSKNADHTFGTTEAKNINKSLDGNEYFIAGHKLTLKTHGDVLGKERFSEIIDEEVSKIFSDTEIKMIFDKIDKALDANKELSAFKKVIEKDNSVLIRLEDYEQFRKEVWFSFLKQIEAGLISLVELYKNKKDELEAIIKKANDGKSAWEDAIEEFKRRFVNMPFSINIKNKADAVLNEQTPTFTFEFEGKSIERKNLIENILSQGEKRAFYILNIIFEIKSRQLQNQKTLFVIDDVADSFDYKNKYAIVEYLNDLSKDSNFYSIILTHNFDFFRTLQSRILTQTFKRSHSFIAEKLSDEIKLIVAGNKNVTDPFMSWRSDINKNEKHLIASIPFIRNLIDFKDGKNNDYLLLTHILHHKNEDTVNNIKASVDICIGDLEAIFSGVISGVNFEYVDNTKKLLDIIEELTIVIKNQPNSAAIVLEDKIILSICIRLKAELYILSKITDLSPISGSQTGKLVQRYKDEFVNDVAHGDAIKVLESVNIMTPENIHLNSFMYEPIMDMGIDELKSLHDEILKLT